MPVKLEILWYGVNKICKYIFNNIQYYNINTNTYTLIRFDYF